MTPLRIVSVRTVYTPEATRGVLAVDGDPWGVTLEDVVRPSGAPKIHGQTAIPAGLYKVIERYSPRFKKVLPWLQDVPGFEYILAHGGNRATDTEGCILVAAKYKAADWIFESISDKLAKAVHDALLAGRPVTWEILDTASRPV